MENCSNFRSCVFFRVVAHSADNFFHVVGHSAENDRRCFHTAEKCLSLFARKNGQIRISSQIRNHVGIYTKVSIRSIEGCVSWRKVRGKILWDCPFKVHLLTRVYVYCDLKAIYPLLLPSCNFCFSILRFLPSLFCHLSCDFSSFLLSIFTPGRAASLGIGRGFRDCSETI